MTSPMDTNASAWIERLARAGYLAKGVVYGAVGVLAVMAAVGSGATGEKTGSSGAIHAIAEQPFGRVLLAFVALGLVGYVVWRLVEAIQDPDGRGTDAKGIAVRIGFAISALTYAALALLAGRIALGMGSGGGSDSKEELTARVMAQPFGQWAVALAGVVVVGIGLRHFQRAWTASFMKKYKTHEMSEKEIQAARHIGRFGISARGVTFCMIGAFIVQAAMRSNPDGATKGLGEALSKLSQQTYGPYLLGLVAAGFIAYGVYCVSRAKYRAFKT
ncbi:DUF1206 domain-containing protein [Planctomycetes bacterium Poly30]